VSSSRRKTGIVAALFAVALAGSLTGCAPAAPAGNATPNSGTLTVFAAASLKATFTRLAAEFEARNPGTKVMLSFAGSSDLATQISQGAPADVFASADTRNMARLTNEGLIDGTATNFATNVLVIAVPPSNPASVTSFADLARPGVKVVACASQVPCGAAADAAEKAAGVALSPVSEESSVTDVLGKVVSGEADAGLVYATDVKGAGDRVNGIPFGESGEAVNTYPIAAVGPGRNKELAEAFIALVAGADGRTILSEAGFGAP
jgi:molybdate transport system substrate-binding protein